MNLYCKGCQNHRGDVDIVVESGRWRDGKLLLWWSGSRSLRGGRGHGWWLLRWSRCRGSFRGRRSGPLRVGCSCADRHGCRRSWTWCWCSSDSHILHGSRGRRRHRRGGNVCRWGLGDHFLLPRSFRFLDLVTSQPAPALLLLLGCCCLSAQQLQLPLTCSSLNRERHGRRFIARSTSTKWPTIVRSTGIIFIWPLPSSCCCNWRGCCHYGCC